MPLLFNRIRIQNKLIEEAKAGPFYAVSYDATTRVASADPNTVIAPSSAVANEISAQFGEGQNHRTFQIDRENWLFQLKVGFDQEVVLEGFENRMLTPVKLARDTANQLDQQATLVLVAVDYQHPTQQANNGTFAVYTFAARLTSKPSPR